jgi:beta-alanine degradation protein BauB
MAFQCTIPAKPTLQREDDDVKITRWDFEPGAATGWHRHAWPYVIVMLTNAIMRVHDGTNVSEMTFTVGDAYVRQTGVEHDVMNGSDTPMAFIEVELKRVPK